MKRKKFYNNKKRNQKWTEEPKGRKIVFADKYIEGASSDKFDYKRPKAQKDPVKQKEKKQNMLKGFVLFVCAVFLISTGYTGMQVYMARHDRPQGVISNKDGNDGTMSEMTINVASVRVESVSLDSSVMLSSVINDAQSNGYYSVTFDAKRSDGTVGYASELASVDTFSAMSSPASKPKVSIQKLLENDILPVAKISCYKDNVVPSQVKEAAVMKGKKLYKDSDSNTYLNPDSEIAYNYLRDIIRELSSWGVTVFVLCDCDLPEEISKDYGDGFEALSEKLYSDVENVKFLEEVDVKITGKDEKSGKITNSAIKKDIKKFDKLKKNQIYFVSTKIDPKRINEQLSKNGVSSYIVD